MIEVINDADHGSAERVTYIAERIDKGYLDLSKKRYIETSRWLNRFDSNLSIPHPSEFIEKLAVLEPMYKKWQNAEWKPDIVFVPDYHNETPVLKQAIKNGYTNWPWESVEHELTLPTNSGVSSNGGGMHWDVAIISNLKVPAIRDISPDGASGKGQEKLKRIFGKTYNKFSQQDLVNLLSPSIDTYFMFQINKIRRGDKTVDNRRGTLLKEYVYEPNRSVCLCGCGTNLEGWMNIACVDIKESSQSVGIRPSILARDLA